MEQTFKDRAASSAALFQKLARYCAYQERCRQDVRLKLSGLGVRGSAEAARWIERLEAEGFLDENRFARAYCRGKFRQNHWGRRKIIMGLRAKGISEAEVAEALNEIDAADYESAGRAVLQAKGWQTALSRGFEAALLREWAKDLAMEAGEDDVEEEEAF
ncbi:MAG: RecX family transcriptional regulator [Bacteroidales bacterium]|nr:RecX family transcriptional regulator [Bacteroidales bacterium]